MNRWKDWLAQSERDLLGAKVNLEAELYEWACFLAQQAGEKAVKAVCEKLLIQCWGHSITKILQKIQNYNVIVPDEVIEAGKILDKFYIPTRYPNGFEEGIPGEYFTKKEATEAISYAEVILEFCRKTLQG
jgi:HEPN domain-containing protein